MAKITLFEVIAIIVMILVTVGCSRTLYSQDMDQTIEDTQTQDTQLTPTTPIIPTPIIDCNCTDNRVCQEGECVCSKSHKLCNDECISKSSCCSNDDCDNGKCVDNKCSFCGICKISEVCQDGDCTCKPSTKFCKEQDMCIQEDFCCSNLDCINNRERKLCSIITLSSEICIQKDHKLCKFLNTKRHQDFILDDDHLKIKIFDIFDNSTSLMVHIGNYTNNHTIILNEEIVIKDYKIWLNSIKSTGGVCVER